VIVRHADHGPGVICRPAFGHGLCEPLGDDLGGAVTGGQHEYTSTACLHGECGSCRKTCKYCGVSCGCQRPLCTHNLTEPGPASWVDQARGIARELLAAFNRDDMSHELVLRIRDDPDLFWLRGEEAPPGTWTGA
jgi:hypothetical protein